MSKLRRYRVFLFILATILVFGVGGFLARDVLNREFMFQFMFPGTRADWDLMQASRQLRVGITPEIVASVRKELLRIARANPDTRAEVTAYLMLSRLWIKSEEAEIATAKLLPETEELDLGDWAEALSNSRSVHADVERRRPLAARLIERVRRQPDHPAAARLLCEVAVLLHPEFSAESAPPELLEVADLIREHYATTPGLGLANFCEVAGDLGSSAQYTQPFEPYVRYILDVNQDRFVRFSAHFALASIVRSGGAARQDEARQLYEDFLAKFDGETDYPAQPAERHCRQWAEQALEIIRSQGIGMTAPEARGTDLAGNPLSLEDYRGRVVLVSFWASWRGPCLKAVPHERALLEKFGETDFAIFGINADDDLDKAHAAVEKHGITWSSLRKSSHEQNWKVYGYPTFYLLDRNGSVNRYWVGEPSAKELEDCIQRLIG